MEIRFISELHQSIRNNWELPALTDYQGETIYYKDFAKNIAQLHAYFKAGGIEKGDKIALCGRNSSNWAMAFFATMSYGAVVVSILHEFDKASVEYIVNHSDAKFFFTDSAIFDKINIDQLSQLQSVVSLDNYSLLHSQSRVENFFDNKEEHLRKQLQPILVPTISIGTRSPRRTGHYQLHFGTTSSPKGVMIPYRSVWSNNKFANDNLPFMNRGDDVVCMLPMAHTYGLAFEIIKSITYGCHIHFLGKVPRRALSKKSLPNIDQNSSSRCP